MSSPEIKTLSSKVVYSNRWITVREDAIQRPSGAEGIYSVVEKPHFAVVIPVQDDQVFLVEQYRYPVAARQLEFPQGSWEGRGDVDPAELAAGELKEETGLVAASMEYVGFQYVAYGLCNQGYHIYVARELTMTEQALDPEEEGLISRKMALTELEERIISGEIKDATTCNAFGLARLKKLL